MFRYFQNRYKKAASELVGAFSGILVCAGYKVYESLQSDSLYTLAGCFAHCRRKFWHAEKAAKKAGTGVVKSLATTALRFIRKLYDIEDEIKGKSPDEIFMIRQKKSLTILDQFHDWLQTQSAKRKAQSAKRKAQ